MIKLAKYALYQVDKDYNKIRKITVRKEKFSQEEMVKFRKKFNMRLKQERIKE